MTRRIPLAIILSLAFAAAVITPFNPGLRAEVRASWVSAIKAQDRLEPEFDPATRLWYNHPADKWENALPVGNGRLGAMVFGKTDDEEIRLNEETYWSGGPYSTVVKGGYRPCPRSKNSSSRATTSSPISSSAGT